MTMPTGSPIGPWHPTARPTATNPPIGLDFDRADIDDTTTVPAGVEVTPLPGRNTAPITVEDPLCGHLPGEPHDGSCDYWRGVALGEYQAPVVHLPAYDLRGLRERHVTAAELHRAEHGQGAA